MLSALLTRLAPYSQSPGLRWTLTPPEAAARVYALTSISPSLPPSKGGA